MLFREIIGLFWESYETHKHILWENEQLLNIKTGGTHAYHLASEELIHAESEMLCSKIQKFIRFILEFGNTAATIENILLYLHEW
jgi:hypothetical protein